MDNIKDSLSFSLFARPSFLEGMSRVLDLGGTLQVYNESKTARAADKRALLSDWLMIGRDLKCAVEKHEQETK